MKKKDKKTEEVAVIAPSKLKEDVEVLEGQVEQASIDDEKSKKKEKVKKIFGEIGAFFILVGIIALVCFGGWYWYTHIYKDVSKDSHQDTSTLNEYTIVTYDTTSNDHEIGILGGKYIYEHYGNKIVKIMDIEAKTLYEGEIEYTSIHLGTDGTLYILLDEYADTENIIEVSKLDNGEVKEAFSLHETGVVYSPLYKMENDEAILYAFLGYGSSVNEHNEKEVVSNFVYYLDGSKKDVKSKALLSGDIYQFAGSNSIYFKEPKSVITSNDGKYGLYDIVNNKELISPTYDKLVSTFDGKYIAYKGNKVGVIDSNGKKYISFDYEYIRAFDDYYVVGKNKKLGIIDSKYKTVIEPKIELQAQSDGNKVYEVVNVSVTTLAFVSGHIGDKYFIATNTLDSEFDYRDNEAYIIKNDGISDAVSEYGVVYIKDDNLLYFMDKDKKEFTFYDDKLEKKFAINMSDYDFSEYVFELCDNTLIESSSNTYYDYTTGEKIDSVPDFVKEMGDLTIKYSYSKNKMTVSIKDEKDREFDIKNFESGNIKYIDDTSFYYNSDNLYVLVKKNV